MVRLLNEAEDEVHRAKRKKARYLGIRNSRSLTRREQEALEGLLLQHTQLRTVKA